jgi:broad specificity phosphatase PhoE
MRKARGVGKLGVYPRVRVWLVSVAILLVIWAVYRLMDKAGSGGGTLVVIVRHGATHYAQGNRVFGMNDWDVSDLTDGGMKMVQQTAADISDMFASLGVRVVHLQSSPMARTLHTARLLSEGIEQPRVGSAIRLDRSIDSDLREIDHYDHDSFQKAAYEVFQRNLTELERQDVFFSDELRNHLDKLSTESREFVERYESGSAAKARMWGILDRLEQNPLPQDEVWLLVSHDGLIGHLVKHHFGTRTSLQRGCFVALELGSRKWVGTNDPALKK